MVDALGVGLARLQFPGKYRVAQALGSAASRVSLRASARIARRGQLTVDLRDRIQRLMWAGCYEPELVRLVHLWLRPGMSFMDVGAHIGFFTVLAAERVAKGGAVFSFEPDVENARVLQANTACYPQVQVYAAALSNSAGETAFFPSPRPDESGWGSLLSGEDDTRSVTVSATTMDDWATVTPLDRLDFIKADIEGAEFRLITGARATLGRFRPVLLLEVNEVCLARDGKSPGELVALLTEVGYLSIGLFQRRSSDLATIFALPGEIGSEIDLLPAQLPTTSKSFWKLLC
jgi:FkbM family methyltransferase